MLRIITTGSAAMGSVALASLAVAVGSSSPAHSAESGLCGPRADIIAKIENDGATRRSISYPRGHGVVELWTSERNGTWSVVVTSARGETCLTARGDEAYGEKSETVESSS